MADETDSTEGSSPPKQNSTIAGMMQNPQVLAALQEQLGRVVGCSSGYIERCAGQQCCKTVAGKILTEYLSSLPKAVQRRIKALKNIQVSCSKLEAEFYKEVHALECKYAEKAKPLYEKRESVISGEYEPTDEECEWESEDEEDDNDQEKDDNSEKLSNELKDKASLNENKDNTDNLQEDVRGIPEFWLTTMKNVDHIAEMIQEHDEPILKSLTSIDLKFIDEEKENSEEKKDNMGFILEFRFAPNAHFNNSVLTKTYTLSCEVDKDAPFSFEGPEITSTSGCTIDWKKGKNVTQKVIKKKQKHKGKGQAKFVNKTVKNDSFFNFFAPPEVPEDGEMDEETEQLLEADFEIGHFFRERLIPKAVLLFTGEAMDDDEFDEEEEEEDEEEEDEDREGDDGEDDDPDFKPPEENPPECKQQ